MPETRLEFRPGVNTVLSETANRGGWSEANRIRFRLGQVEKIGGWQKICNTAFRGLCRALHWWIDLNGLPWIALGTNLQLALIQGSTFFDITPGGLQDGLASSTPGMPYTLRIWSLDNFGEQLLAVPSGGPLYAWIEDDFIGGGGIVTPGQVNAPQLVPTAPARNQGMFVSMPEEIVVSFGCTPFEASNDNADPLLLRWSDQTNYSVWNPTTTNQAGSFRLSRGSRIIGALQFPLMSLVWTNLDLWTMSYQGFPLVFSVTQIAALCGLIAQNAVCALGSTVYWMSDHGFFAMPLGGAAAQLPCAVWDTVYQDLDSANVDKCVAGPSYNFSEIFWFYPSKSGGISEIDSYVKYNIAENLWDYGKLARTAWTDQNAASGGLTDGQLAADPNGFVQQHEVGYDDDGNPMQGVTIRSGWLDLDDGETIQLVKRLIPDFLWRGPNPSAMVTLYFRNFPGGATTKAGPFTITPNTAYQTIGTYLDAAQTVPVIGIRGREVALEIDCSSAGTWFRYGAARVLRQPDGKL